MAGDWVMMDHELPEKAEVLAIFERTGVEIPTIIGRLYMLWTLADRTTTDGIMQGVGKRSLCNKCGGDADFWDAVCAVGWLEITSEGCTVPEFAERFGTSSKARKIDARRKASERANRAGHGSDNSRTEHGQDADATRTVDGPHNREPIFGSSGVFSKLTTAGLRSTEAVLALTPADASEATKRKWLGAAERAIEKGKNPPALFQRIVKGGLWDLISQKQQARGDERYAKHLRGPPANGAHALASIADAFAPPTD